MSSCLCAISWGDENDRNVTDQPRWPSAPSTPVTPTIESFKVEAIKADAPATFRVVSQVKNADWCIWSVSDDRPMEISKDASGERYFTITEPGFHTVKLAAVSGGNQPVERAESVWVDVGNSAAAGATLLVTFQAAEVKRMPKEVNVPITFPHDSKEQTFPFSVTHVESEYQIAGAKFLQPPQTTSVKDVHLTISPDKTKVVLSGELVKPGGIMALQRNPAPVKWTPTVVLSLEKRLPPVVKTLEPIMANLKLPGTTVLPLPKLSKHWDVRSASLTLELRDGANVVYKGYTFPASATVNFKNEPYQFTATQGPDGIHLDMVSAKARLLSIGN